MNYTAAKTFILNKLEKELSDQLTYHGLHHTLDVLNITKALCDAEKVSPYNRLLLKTAALFHDSGFIINNIEHERLGCSIARETLPRFNYSAKDIEVICGMIMATKIPQSPKNHLEEIICDADLDYLGRDDFYPIGRTLFEELKNFNIIQEEEKWNRIQVDFLENHDYFTATNIARRKPVKGKYLMELKEIVAGYEKK